MPFLSYKEKKIFYRIKETESKNVIIFIHGSGGSSNTWKNQFDLEVNYDLIAIDLPSHNNSNEFSELTLDLYVDVIRQLIKSLNYDNLILCGHSLGGAITQQYYFTYPKEVSGLILCSTGGRLRVAPIILNSLKTNYQEFLDSLPSGIFYRKTPRELIDNYVQETSKIKAVVTYEDFKICDNFDTIDKTDSIEVPCLIIVGKEDKLTPVKFSQFFRDKIKNSDLNVINDAGHMVMLEKPSEVNKSIENFIINYFN